MKGYMGGMSVPVPAISGRKLPVHHAVPQGWLVGWLGRQRGGGADSYSSP